MFSKVPTLTDVGKTLLLRAAGGESFTLTKYQAGSGILGPGETPQTRTALKHVELSNIGLTQAQGTEENGYIQVVGTFNNSGDGFTAFKWTELGLIAEDESNNEYLYAYAYDNDNAEMIYPATEGVEVEQTISFDLFIGDTDHITAYLLPATTYATKADLDDHEAASNPHGTSYSDVGAAPAEHTHSALEIASDILPVARGGTGVSSYAELFAAITGYHSYFLGSFNGDGSARKDILLGYKPSMVMIFTMMVGYDTVDGQDFGNYAFSPGHTIYYRGDYGTQAMTDTDAMLAAGHGGAGVTNNGFAVSQCQQGNGRYDMNFDNRVYVFIVFK